MRKLFSIFIACTIMTLFQHNILLAQSVKYLYNNLIEDLVNIDISGYKAISLQNNIRDLMTQGALYKSENRIDIGIIGKGFFRYIDKNNNIYYSRNGKLHLSTDGTLRNEFNDQFQSKYTIPSKIDFNLISISSSGKFEYVQENSSSKLLLFQIIIYEQINISKIKEIDGSRYLFTNALETNSTEYKIISGCYESSTVSTIPVLFKCIELLHQMKSENLFPNYLLDSRLDFINNIIGRIDNDFIKYYQLAFPYLKLKFFIAITCG